MYKTLLWYPRFLVNLGEGMDAGKAWVKAGYSSGNAAYAEIKYLESRGIVTVDRSNKSLKVEFTEKGKRVLKGARLFMEMEDQQAKEPLPNGTVKQLPGVRK